VTVAGFILLALGLLLALPRGFTGGSSYSRIAPISSSHIESTPGYRDDSYVSFNWKQLLVGHALAAVGVLLLIVGL
jgi:hypothetical protein